MDVGRRRIHNTHLPRGVTLERGSYFFRGYDRKRLNLGRGFADAMIRYGELHRDDPLKTFGDVLDRYLREVTPGKAPRTQVDERAYIGRLRAVFGALPSTVISAPDCAKLRDTIAAKSGNVQANHHLKTLKHALRKAVEWGAVAHNAAREVSKLKVRQRERYVTDAEFAAVRANAPPMIRIAMEIAVLTGLRRGDILALTKDACHDDGLHVGTSKTKRDLIFEWTPDLRAVIDDAKAMQPRFRQAIVATRSGKPFTGNGFGTEWRKVMVRTYPKGREHARWRFNDIRSKSASDTAELAAASARLGHTSTAVTKRHYIRKPAKVTPLR